MCKLTKNLPIQIKGVLDFRDSGGGGGDLKWGGEKLRPLRRTVGRRVSLHEKCSFPKLLLFRFHFIGNFLLFKMLFDFFFYVKRKKS